MFNLVGGIKKENLKVEKMRWADSIKSITKIGVIQNKATELRIYYDSNMNKEEHKKEMKNKKLC